MLGWRTTGLSFCFTRGGPHSPGTYGVPSRLSVSQEMWKWAGEWGKATPRRAGDSCRLAPPLPLWVGPAVGTGAFPALLCLKFSSEGSGSGVNSNLGDLPRSAVVAVS